MFKTIFPNLSTEDRKNEIRSFSPLFLMGLVNLYEGLTDPTKYARTFSGSLLRIMPMAEAKAYLLAVRANYNRCIRELESTTFSIKPEVRRAKFEERNLWDSYFVALEDRIEQLENPVNPFDQSGADKPETVDYPDSLYEELGNPGEGGLCLSNSRCELPIESKAGQFLRNVADQISPVQYPAKLSKRLWGMMKDAAKTCGSFNPDQNMMYYMDELTPAEYSIIRNFLNFVITYGYTMGDGNYQDRYQEFRKAV